MIGVPKGLKAAGQNFEFVLILAATLYKSGMTTRAVAITTKMNYGDINKPTAEDGRSLS